MDTHNSSVLNVATSGIYHHDSTLPFKLPGTVELVYSDPPFNLNLNYGSVSDCLEERDYRVWAGKWVRNCARGDWFVICTPPEWSVLYSNILESCGYSYYDKVIWHRTFGQNSNSPKRLGRAFTEILIYKLPGTRVDGVNWDWVTSERQRIGDKRANPNGKIEGNVWQIPMVTGNSSERRPWHPTQQPSILVKKIIKGLNVKSVFEPFSGSGTTVLVCKELGIPYVGFDLNEDYVNKVRLMGE